MLICIRIQDLGSASQDLGGASQDLEASKWLEEYVEAHDIPVYPREILWGSDYGDGIYKMTKEQLRKITEHIERSGWNYFLFSVEINVQPMAKKLSRPLPLPEGKQIVFIDGESSFDEVRAGLSPRET
jgi:hypothetical protein